MESSCYLAIERYVSVARAARTHVDSMLPDNRDWTIDDIERVLVVVSSSRGGSSLLYRILTCADGALGIGGEHTPFYRLSDVGIVRTVNDSDEVTEWTPQQLATFRSELEPEIGVGPEHPLGADPARGATEPDRITRAFARRLVLQWPHLDIAPDEWVVAVQDVVADLRLDGRHRTSPEAIFAAVVDRLAERHPIDLGCYYRSPPQTFGEGGPPAARGYIEETPFVAPQITAILSREEVRARTLVLKASVDAYRLPFVLAAFPSADVRVVHLTRHPAPSVNGMVDAWRSRWFFSHNLAEVGELGIGGYSECAPWGQSWWNLELPPEWAASTSLPVAAVCARQWAGAHQAALRALSGSGVERLRVRFEDLLGSSAVRRKACRRIFDFAGISCDPRSSAMVERLPVVMAIVAPDEDRWQARRDEILPALAEDGSGVAATAAELGYRL